MTNSQADPHYRSDYQVAEDFRERMRNHPRKRYCQAKPPEKDGEICGVRIGRWRKLPLCDEHDDRHRDLDPVAPPKNPQKSYIRGGNRVTLPSLYYWRTYYDVKVNYLSEASNVAPDTIRRLEGRGRGRNGVLGTVHESLAKRIAAGLTQMTRDQHKEGFTLEALQQQPPSNDQEGAA